MKALPREQGAQGRRRERDLQRAHVGVEGVSREKPGAGRGAVDYAADDKSGGGLLVITQDRKGLRCDDVLPESCPTKAVGGVRPPARSQFGSGPLHPAPCPRHSRCASLQAAAEWETADAQPYAHGCRHVRWRRGRWIDCFCCPTRDPVSPRLRTHASAHIHSGHRSCASGVHVGQIHQYIGIRTQQELTATCGQRHRPWSHSGKLPNPNRKTALFAVKLDAYAQERDQGIKIKHRAPFGIRMPGLNPTLSMLVCQIPGP